MTVSASGVPEVHWTPELAIGGGTGLTIYDEVWGVYRFLDVGDVIPTGRVLPAGSVSLEAEV
jgi:hypothetical protein